MFEFYRYLYITAAFGELSDKSIYISKDLLRSKKTAYKPKFAKLLNEVGIIVTADKFSVTLTYENADLFVAIKMLALQYYDESRYSAEIYPESVINLQTDLFCFAVCCFDNNREYLLKRFDDMYNLNGLLLKLKETCEQKGYVFDTVVKLSETDFSISCKLNTGVGGFGISYNPRKESKVGFGTQNGIGEKAMIEDFDNLSEIMKEHFIDICKQCTDCQY